MASVPCSSGSSGSGGTQPHAQPRHVHVRVGVRARAVRGRACAVRHGTCVVRTRVAYLLPRCSHVRPASALVHESVWWCSPGAEPLPRALPLTQVYKSMVADYTADDAEESVAADWEADREGADVVSEATFKNVMFDLAQTWTPGSSAKKFAGFLRDLLLTVTDDGKRFRHDLDIVAGNGQPVAAFIEADLKKLFDEDDDDEPPPAPAPVEEAPEQAPADDDSERERRRLEALGRGAAILVQRHARGSEVRSLIARWLEHEEATRKQVGFGVGVW